MAKTLYIHIGHYKTGTTALQVFCVNNETLLKSNGLTYEESHLRNAKHSSLAFSLYKAVGVDDDLMHNYGRPETPEELWQAMFDELRAARTNRMLISTEEFMRLAEFPDATARLKSIIERQASDIEIKVIAYLRPPADQLHSWYNQMVKMRQKIGDFDSALALGQIEAIHYDYEHALAPWIEIFGRDALIVRPYPDRAQPAETLILDFLSIFDISVSAEEARPERDPNPRLDDRMLDLLRQAQNDGLPPKQARNIHARAAEYLDVQSAFVGAGGGLVHAQERADQGLKRLGETLGMEFSHLSGPIAPRDTGPSVEALTLQIGFLQSELLTLRKHIWRLERKLGGDTDNDD